MRLLLGRERLQRRRYNNNIYSAILFVLWARTPSGTQLSSRRGCHRVLRSNKQRRQMHENKIGLLRFRVCVIAAAASFVHFCGSAPALVLLLSLKYTAPYIHWGLFLAMGATTHCVWRESVPTRETCTAAKEQYRTANKILRYSPHVESPQITLIATLFVPLQF